MSAPICRCGHAAQIHGADKPGNDRGYLTPAGPRGAGACSAHCWCDQYVKAPERAA